MPEPNLIKTDSFGNIWLADKANWILKLLSYEDVIYHVFPL